MKLIDVIPELTFVYATEYSEAYVIKENGFRPMILVVDILNKEFFINYRKYSYQKQSEITKAIYDFQNEHIEKGYKEDALVFRKLKSSNYKSLIEKMLNNLDEKKELFCDKVKYEGKADKTLEEKLGSVDYKKFIEHCEELCNKPFLPSDIFNFPNTKPTYEELEKSLQKHKDVLWKQFGTSLMYDDKYYQRTEYKPRKEVQDGLGNYYCHSDIDNSKVEMYDAEPYCVTITEPSLFRIKIPIGSPKGTKQKNISNDVFHIIEPNGKNYFLFKLS